MNGPSSFRYTHDVVDIDRVNVDRIAATAIRLSLERLL